MLPERFQSKSVVATVAPDAVFFRVRVTIPVVGYIMVDPLTSIEN